MLKGHRIVRNDFCNNRSCVAETVKGTENGIVRKVCVIEAYKGTENSTTMDTGWQLKAQRAV